MCCSLIIRSDEDVPVKERQTSIRPLVEEYLKVLLMDGEVPINGSASEWTLRNFIIGRENWMNIYTVCGAEARAGIYSITETAKANGLNVYYYIKCLLE